MNSKVCILDYGSGNVSSVFNMISRITNCVVSNNLADIHKSSHLVLPGVGSFNGAINKIKEKLPIKEIYSAVNSGLPFLGICVGMQVLAEEGQEFGISEGLGWVQGKIKKLDNPEFKIPHIGWNNLIEISNHKLLENIDEDDDFYFVHSYAFREIPNQYILAKTDYGSKFPSIISRDNIFGVQFHPEKSQNSGLKLIRNFLLIK